MNLKEALKAAIDGAKIRLPTWSEQAYLVWLIRRGYFVDENATKVSFDETETTSELWEIVPEPVKYSVDFWFFEEPKVGDSNSNFSTYLLNNIAWSLERTNLYNKKYRITVEEVAE